jgi:3-oxoadipate enol-lactonase
MRFLLLILLMLTGVQAEQSEAFVLERKESNLHYFLHGDEDRPLVVFTHGATMDHRMFDAQVEAVAEEYRVLTWDVRGHGLSKPLGDTFSMELAADDLVAILDEIGVEQAVMVGQSMGSYISQEVLYRYPDRVAGLVSIGGTALIFEYSEAEKQALSASLPLLRLLPYDTLKPIIARNTAYTEEAQAYALEAVNQISREEFITIWEGVTGALREEEGYRIEVPLLITYGEHDNTGSIKSNSPEWAERDTDSVYHVIPDAGHNANQDNAEFFNELLMEFLEGVTQ